MRSFFKYVLATVTGTIIVFAIILIVLIGFITATISSMGSKEEVYVPSNAVLYVSLNHHIPERTSSNPWESMNLPGYGEMKSLGLNDILSRSEEHTSELQSRENLVCRLLLEKKK